MLGTKRIQFELYRNLISFLLASYNIRITEKGSKFTDYLYAHADKQKVQSDAAREVIRDKELLHCTFKPFLFKPPKNVHASYRFQVAKSLIMLLLLILH